MQLVWNATTYEKVFADRIRSTGIVDVSFSLEGSTRLVSADGTALFGT